MIKDRNRVLAVLAVVVVFAAWIGAAVLCGIGIQLRTDYLDNLRANQEAGDQIYDTKQHVIWLRKQLAKTQAVYDGHIWERFYYHWPDGHRKFENWQWVPAPDPEDCTYCENLQRSVDCQEEEITHQETTQAYWEHEFERTVERGLVLAEEMEAHEDTCQECTEVL